MFPSHTGMLVVVMTVLLGVVVMLPTAHGARNIRTDGSGLGLIIEAGGDLTLTAATTRMDGKLGVGVAAQTVGSRLSVNGGVAIGASFIGSGEVTNGLIVQGNVGIGTDTPSSQLHVVEAVAGAAQARVENTVAGQSASVFVRTVAGGANPYVALQRDSGGWSLGVDSAQAFRIVNSEGFSLAGAPLTISSAGDVGIGTASPTESLDVMGNVKATGVVAGGDVTITSNGVLREESRTASAIRVVGIRNSQQLPASSTQVTITWNTLEYGSTARYNGATGHYELPTGASSLPGLYFACAKYELVDVAISEQVWVHLCTRRDGVETCKSQFFHVPAAGQAKPQLCADLHIASGYTTASIFVKGMQTGTASAQFILNDGSRSYFSVRYVMPL